MMDKKPDGLKTEADTKQRLGSEHLNATKAAKASGIDEEKVALKADLTALKNELATLKKALEAKDHDHKRALADYHNVLERSQRDIRQAQIYGLQSFAKALLPTMDTFEQAIASSQQTPVNVEAMVDGVVMTYDMTIKTLKDFEIEAIDPLDQPFDPDLHEAISAQPMDDKPDNTVIQVVQKGYRIKDRLLRPAMVVVSQQAS